jgi:hypothetical protein
MGYAEGSLSLGHVERPAADEVIWRYIDLPRLAAILQEGAFPFVSARSMSDKWEGALGGPPKNYIDSALELPVSTAMQQRLQRASTYLSSWYAAPGESVAMWQIYAATIGSVCIRGTWGGLTQSLIGTNAVDGGFVAYADSVYESFPSAASESATFLLKRSAFAHEREVRLLFVDTQGFDPITYDAGCALGFYGSQGQDLPAAQMQEADLSRAIEAIYLAPYTPVWVELVVRRLVLDSQYQIEIRRSAIEAQPPH